MPYKPKEKKKPTKNKRPVEEESESCSETEVQTVKKKKDEDFIETLAIVFNIENEKHPFFSLNMVPGTVDIEKIISPTERNELIKGTKISFMHEKDNCHLLVDATIESSKIFKIPKSKTGKVFKENKSANGQPLEKLFATMNDNINKLNNSVLKMCEEQKSLNDSLTNSSQVRQCTSNQANSEISFVDNNKSDDFQEPGTNFGLVNNKEFTSFLRSELDKTFKEKDPNQTLSYYVTKYPSEMLNIKNGLLKFVPKGSTFKDAWDRASNSLKTRKP
ncbi:unnamed protein product, partial [Brachionus calyciflorus]